MIILFEIGLILLVILSIISFFVLMGKRSPCKKKKERLFIGYSSEQVNPYNLYPTLEDLIRSEFFDKNPANCVAFKNYDGENFGEIINDFGELVRVRELDLGELKEIKEIAYNLADKDEEKRKLIESMEPPKIYFTGVFTPYFDSLFPEKTQKFNIVYNEEFNRVKRERSLSWNI